MSILSNLVIKNHSVKPFNLYFIINLIIYYLLFMVIHTMLPITPFFYSKDNLINTILAL